MIVEMEKGDWGGGIEGGRCTVETDKNVISLRHTIASSRC